MDDLREALSRVAGLLATDARDWSRARADAWLWGLLVGWDCEDHLVWPDHQHGEDCGHDGAMRAVAERHHWSDDDVARLRRYRRAVWAAAYGSES